MLAESEYITTAKAAKGWGVCTQTYERCAARNGVPILVFSERKKIVRVTDDRELGEKIRKPEFAT